MAAKVSPRDLTGRQKAALDAERARQNEFTTDELISEARDIAFMDGVNAGIRQVVKLYKASPAEFAELLTEFENAE